MALCPVRDVLVEHDHPDARARLSVRAVAASNGSRCANTYYGDLRGRFEGSGARLFFRGVLLWLSPYVPFTVGLIAAFGAVDWTTSEAAGRGDDDRLSWIETSGLAAAAVYRGGDGDLGGAFVGDSLSGVSGHGAALVDLGVALRRGSRVDRVWARHGLWRLWSFPLVRVPIRIRRRRPGRGSRLRARRRAQVWLHRTLSEIIATAALIAAYVIVALAYSTIYQATVRLRAVAMRGSNRSRFPVPRRSSTCPLAGKRARRSVRGLPTRSMSAGCERPMTTSGSAIFFDGETSARHDVTVELTPEVLRRSRPGWNISRRNGLTTSSTPCRHPRSVLRLGRRGSPVLARLEVRDAALAAAIDDRSPPVDRSGAAERRDAARR